MFSQDSDFKESMFARQIAVMKGQAWNVVETLKTPDHGPLELTRRTRVCVWDDVVDIPVAIPLRVPSAEMRRRRDAYSRSHTDEEEMDISTVNASAPLPQHDLLGLSSPSSDLPNPDRFELSHNDSLADPGAPTDDPATSAIVKHAPWTNEAKLGDVKTGPARMRTQSDLDRNHRRGGPGTHRRRFSSSARYGGSAFLYDGDESEGDLGYTAAEGMEGNQKKVIMERLDTVKTQNPVFSWC